MRQAIAMGILAAWCFTAAACGGSDKKVEDPDSMGAEPEPEPDDGDDMIDPEVFEDIRRTFERKQTVVGRCFVEGVDSGEIEQTARGYVTVVAEIHPDGSARDIKISETTLESQTLHRCVIGLVESWTFPEPSRPINQSFTYVLERL